MPLLFPTRPDVSVGCPKKHLADKPPCATGCTLLPVPPACLHLPAVLGSCQPEARGAGGWLCALLSTSLSRVMNVVSQSWPWQELAEPLARPVVLLQPPS